MNPAQLLDRHYAGELGCLPADFDSGKVRVVSCPCISRIRFAKGVPLALFAIARDKGTVVSVLPGLVDAAQQALEQRSELDDPACDLLEQALTPLLESPSWFRGCRLYCTADTFVDLSTPEVVDLSHASKSTRSSSKKWGGPVFGELVQGSVAAAAVVKVLSDSAWDVGVATDERFRGRGYAKRAVSAAVRYILEQGRIATWGCDRDNHASLAVARAVGFQPYGLDFGCIATMKGRQ